ncbi:MAG: hypothetical protein J7M38_04755 [Armatimonadetes bacterium]|nr:hypothetical protein [Armatimonadota bacterium]
MSRLAVAVLMVVLCIGLAWGQSGTLNLPSAVPWQDDAVQVKAQVRAFEGGDNQTYNVTARGRLGTDAEVQLGYFCMGSEGEDPIAGIVRKSNLHLLTLTGLWQVQEGSWRMALRGGGEFPIHVTEGINTALMASAPEFRAIPVGSVVLEWGQPDGLLVLFEAKGGGFDADMPVTGQVYPGATLIGGGGTNGQVVEGFGSVFMVGAGVRRYGERIQWCADLAFPLSGDNSIDENTNRVEQAIAWSAGLSYLLGGSRNVTIDLGVSNSAGSTMATSTIVAPGSSVGFVGGISCNW